MRKSKTEQYVFGFDEAVKVTPTVVVAEPTMTVEASEALEAAKKQEREQSRVARRAEAKALKAVEAEKMRIAVREKWASWQPACMGPAVVVSSLVLIGGGL